MEKERYARNESNIQRLLKQGRGQAIGYRFTPCLFIRHVPNRGRSHTVFGRASCRVRTLPSDIEYAHFLIFDRDESVIDNRDQFYLNRNDNTRIADACGFRHPKDPASDTLAVVTTDLVVTDCNKQVPINKAFAGKPFSELHKPHIGEKLTSHEFYLIDKNVSFDILMERDVPLDLKRYLHWLREYRDVTDFEELRLEYFTSLTKNLLIRMSDYCTHRLSLSEMCARLHDTFACVAGAHIMTTRHMLSIGIFH